MSLEDLLRKLASSAEASPEILTIPREIQVFAHDDTSARAVLARLRSEWEAHARTSPRRALVLAMAVFRVSRDWQRRWPLGDFLPKLAESLRGVSHEAELEREVASLLRELPKAELAAVLEHASTPGPSCPEGTCLERLGGARVLARVGSFAHPTHEEHHAASDVDAVLAAVASLGSSSLDDLHAALGVFTGTLDEVARAAFLLGAVKMSVESGLPIAAHWLTGARGHETLSDALARPYDEGPLAAAFASVVSRLPSETRLAVLEKSAVAFMPTYGHFVGREEPSFVRATVEACAALGGDGKHTLGRAKTAARVVTMLGPPVEAEVVRALPAATPEGLLAFTLALENEEVARSAVELLGHAHKDIRREAAEALRAYGPAADRALEEGTRAKKKAVRETCSALLDERRSARENPLDRALAVLDEAARTELETTVSRLSSEPAVLQSFGNPRLLANGAFDRFGPAAYLASAYRRWLSRPESRDAERPVTYGLERWMEVRESSPDELVNEIFVHVAVHLPALEDHQVERFVLPLVPFLRAHTGRLAEAIAHRGEVSGRIVLVEAVLAKNPADVSTVFWAEAMSDGSKRIRKIAAQSLAGRRGLAEALTPVLSAKKAEIRVAVADLIARERCEGVAEILRAARALETDAKAAAALDRALAAVPDGATEPSVGRASTVARGASKTERVSPSDVRAELAAMKKGKIPKFASSALLPTPTWADGADLSEHELAVLFSRLANEGSDLEDPELRRIRAALVPASAAAFGDALYDAWYEGGRDSKHKFAVFQLGLFGSERRLDEVAQRLGIEASHGQHHYATWCLEALARRGRALQDEATSPADGPAVDTGLSWVAHWARAATTESLGHGARELLARERELRGLDERAFAERVNPFVAADAADRSIVRVDLETRFTFGARSFSPAVVHGRLALRADNGTVLEALPKRSPKDEPAAHENEKQRFEALSGHVAHVLAWESSRLEGAMVSHRVWPVPAFLELAAHPLVRHLLEGLLARAGTLLFRASLTGPVDVDARPVPKERLLAAPGVTLPHRIDLDPPTLTAWREHLHRADVRPPFAQLDREVHEDLADLAVDRLRTLRAQALVARLLEARWQHGRPHENGLYDESFRLFSGYGVRAVFHHDGIGIASNDFQTGPIGLHSLRFEDVFGKALEPSEVPAVVRSEVARDLRAILR
jgi:hypothetical protein